MILQHETTEIPVPFLREKKSVLLLSVLFGLRPGTRNKILNLHTKGLCIDYQEGMGG